MSDLISIIIPIYKGEHYINRCVNSALRQTYNNLEIILVDNGELSDARNKGIYVDSGNYIVFIDGDD